MRHTNAIVRISMLALGLGASAQDSQPGNQPKPRAIPAKAMRVATQPAPLHAMEVERMDGTKTRLSDWKGKVVLLVNTASKCGLTPQYAGLEKLHEKFAEQGFTVLAFPANDFGKQEPGTNVEIAQFCKENYSVTFPVFAKVAVKGPEKCELYKYLTEQSPFPGDITWNFEKFLIARDGQVAARFAPKVKPDDEKLVAEVEAELAKAVPAPAARMGAMAAAPAARAAAKPEIVGGPTAGKDAIDAALATAKQQDKTVFVHFSADWCGWCKKLEEFMALAPIEPIFAASFVHVRVATDHMKDGDALCKQYAEGKSTGIPFMVWLDADGKVLARSFDEKGENIGYPSSAKEIDAFMKTFSALAKKAKPDQIELVEKTLRDRSQK